MNIIGWQSVRLMASMKFIVIASVLMSVSNQVQAEREIVERGILSGIAKTYQKAETSSVVSLTNLGYTSVSMDNDDQTVSGSIGYRHSLTKHWSLDLNYLDYGKIRPQVKATLPIGKTNAQAARDIAQSLPVRGRGISAVGLYHHPLGRHWVGQVGAGAFIWRSEREAVVNGTHYVHNGNGVSPVIQLGLIRPLTSRIRLEGQLQYFAMPDEGVKRLGVGLAIGF